MMKKLVLVVDDDENVQKYLACLLSSLDYEVRCLGSGEKLLADLAAGSSPAVVLLDLVMPGLSGLDTLDRLKTSHPRIPVIVLSSATEISTVVSAVRRGASDYLPKTFQDEELQLALQNVTEKQELRHEVAVLRRRLDRDEDGFVSRSARLLRVKEIGRQVADTDAPVLILGESGVGKEVVARFIHGQSRRASQAFVKVNCAALPEDLLESELFGYEKGAFSGALHQKPGMFELADGGTILLDEIGEMSFHLQAKLLHVLQDGEFTRLGGRQTVKVDARVMASTNVCLDEAVAAGRFRADLFFRLNVIRLEVPSLRDRREDIPLLCRHFLKTYAVRYKSQICDLPRSLEEAMLRHDWPGNVRELENVVRRYVILGDTEASIADLRGGRGRVDAPAPPSEPHAPTREEPAGPDGLSLRKVGAKAAEEAERRLLRRVLDETRWNRREAARQLKISYKALLNKLKRWEVDAPLRRPAGDDVVHAAAREVAPFPVPVAAVAARKRDVLVEARRWPRPATR
jgi:two-component system response regulator AtoC